MHENRGLIVSINYNLTAATLYPFESYRVKNISKAVGTKANHRGADTSVGSGRNTSPLVIELFKPV